MTDSTLTGIRISDIFIDLRRRPVVLVEWLLLAVMAPFMLFPRPATIWMMLLLPAWYLILWMRRSQPVVPSAASLPLTLLLAMTGVGFLVAYDPWNAAGKLAGIVWGVGIFLAMLRLGRTRPGLTLGLMMLAVAGAVIAGVSLVGTRWPATKVFALDAITALLPELLRGLQGAAEGFHPNQVAGTLLWVLPVQAGLAWLFWRDLRGWVGKPGAVLAILTAILSIFILLLTQSRTAYLALAGGIALAIWWVLPGRVRLASGIAGVAVIVLAAGAIVTGSVDLAGMLSQSTPIEASAVSVDTLETRAEIWSRAIFAIQDFPLTGVGLNAFREIVHIFYPLFLLPPDIDFGHAHNEFLQAALDLGIPGLIAFLGLNFLVLTQLNDHLRSAVPASWKLVLVAVLAGWLGHLLFGMIDAVALGAKTGFVFWMLAGIAFMDGWQRPSEETGD